MSGDAGPKVQRRLAAIFAADVEGYSRLMGADEVGTLQTLTAHRETMDRLIAEHRGRIANTAGDSVLAEFPSVVVGVQTAVLVQEGLRVANEQLPEDRQVRFRIGVHVGDVLVKGGDLFGDGVNIAAVSRPSLIQEGCASPGMLTGTFARLCPSTSLISVPSTSRTSPSRFPRFESMLVRSGQR